MLLPARLTVGTLFNVAFTNKFSLTNSLVSASSISSNDLPLFFALNLSKAT